jgi:hypothetical protein
MGLSTAANETYKKVSGSQNTYMEDIENELGVDRIENPLLRTATIFGIEMFDPVWYMDPSKPVRAVANGVARALNDRFVQGGVRVGNYVYRPERGVLYSGVPMNYERVEFNPDK